MTKKILFCTIFLTIILILVLCCKQNVKMKQNTKILITEKLKENNGWFQGIIDNSIYNTIGNASEIGIANEIKNGWELIGYYSINDCSVLESYAKFNLTVFKKPLMKFFYESNPWQNKKNIIWLPDLAYLQKSKDKIQQTKSLGHNCPTVLRKCICTCCNDSFLIGINNSKIIGKCTDCDKEIVIWDNEDYLVDFNNENIKSLANKVVNILYSIEYSVDSESGDDFSWISINVSDKNRKIYNIADGEM